MYAVKGIYDGVNFKLSEPAPVREEYEVVITFTAPLKKKTLKKPVKNQREILKYFGTWDKKTTKCVLDIMKERKNFSLGRPEP
jgi:hypothetical protein